MTHKDLDVWKQSIDLVLKIYKICNEIPNDEKFGLIAQIKRSVISIPSNIAEGFERHSNKEYIRYLYIAKGSCGELRTQLYIASKVEEIDNEKGNELVKKTKEISAMLQGLINTRKTKF